MAKVGILCPYGMCSKVFNLLQPLTKEKNYEMVSVEFFGKLMNNNLEGESHTIHSLVAASSDIYKNYFEQENIIEIGFQHKDNKADVIICLYKDMVEAEEALIDSKVQYNKLFTKASEANYYANDEVELVSKVARVL